MMCVCVCVTACDKLKDTIGLIVGACVFLRGVIFSIGCSNKLRQCRRSSFRSATPIWSTPRPTTGQCAAWI